MIRGGGSISIIRFSEKGNGGGEERLGEMLYTETEEETGIHSFIHSFILRWVVDRGVIFGLTYIAPCRHSGTGAQ